jgi:hypothetical protein
MLIGHKGGFMRSKILIIIAIFAIMPAIYYTGLSAGQKQARQDCIDKVSENCEYICGVGADFYFPDKLDQQLNDYEDLDRDSLIARKENCDYPPLPMGSYR